MGKMKPKVLGNALRGMALLLGAAGLFVLALAQGGWFDYGDTAIYRRALPLCALPCYAALVLFWRVAGNIAHDRSFCAQNVRLMRAIGVLAFAETAGVAAAAAVLLARAVIGPRILPLLACIVVMGLCIGVACLALSALVDRARLIQEENDFTV